MLKKLIAMTLAFCLMFSMLPVTQVSADTGYSEGLSYTLSDDGTSYIVSGIGDCTDTNLVVPSTYNGLPVTAIGDWAFQDSYELTSVTLPDSITAIGDYAFGWCYDLTSINIPNGVTTIGWGAFQQCESLTEIHIPASVASIGSGAFSWCSKLTQITVDADNAAYCAVDGVLYTKDMSNLLCYPAGKAGVSFSVPGTVTTIGQTAFASCGKLTAITLPEGLLAIESDAFNNCYKLESVEIPSTVTAIYGYAFSSCSRLTSVTIPVSVTFMSNGVFAWCNSLREILVEEGNSAYCSVDGVVYTADMKNLVAYPVGKPDSSFAIPSGVETVYGDAFCGSYNLSEIIIPDSMTTISNCAFECCFGLASIAIPDGVTCIEAWAFSDCENLTSVAIPASVTHIGRRAFNYCQKLTAVYYAGTQAQWDAITKESDWDRVDWEQEERPFTIYYLGECELNGHSWVDADCENPKHCTSCGTTDGEALGHEFVDDYCTVCGKCRYSLGLSYTLSDDGTYYIVSGIGDCTDTDLVIPATYNGLPVTAIGDYAFQDCYELTSITLPDSITAIGDYAFAWCYDLTSINIPNGVTTIGWAAFQQCESLTEIAIPASVTNIGTYAFSWCSKLTQITVDADNAAYCAVDGVLYSKDMTTLHIYPAGKAGTSFSVPGTVTTIGQTAFASCGKLTAITLPEGLLIIRSNAFLDCYNLKSIDISSTVTEIDSFAFQNCSGLTSVTIPASVRLLDWGVFLRCSNLTEILVETGNNYFCSVDGAVYTADMKTLVAYPVGKPDVSFSIPAGTQTIHGYAFGGSEHLTEIILPDSMTSIANYAFANCRSLQSITIPANVTTIGNGAFQECDSLVSIVIPNGVTRIENYTFSNCQSLTSVTIPVSVTYIGRSVFNWCKNLKEIRYAGSKAQWDAITKENNWDNRTGAYSISYAVFCTDGHTWTDATCTAPVTCVNCGLTEGIALGHNFVDDVCTVCGNYDYNGKLVKIYYPNGQTYVTATANGNRLAIGTNSEAAVWTVTVDENGYLIFACNDLYMTSGPNGNQLYMSDTLTDCGRWELTESDGGVLLRNVGAVYNGQYNQYLEFYRAFTTYGLNTNNLPIYTFQLIVVEGCEAYGHDWTDATCQETKYCQVCGAEGGNGDHNVVDGVCTLCGIVLSQGLEYTLSKDGTSYIVTGIGTCTDNDLVIPATYEGLPVTAIGDNAFQDCEQLTSVTLPSSVTTIGVWAFYYCWNLTDVNISSSVTSIGYGAFQSCRELTEMHIPASVASIGSGAFSWCSKLTQITVDADNAAYCAVDGMLYNKDMTTLHTYPAGKAGTSFEIPYGITTINSGAFRGSRNLTGIIIPSSVTTIGDGAFSNCGLTSITIPASVQHIGGSVLENCDSLVEILVEEDNANYCSVDGVLYTEDMSTLMWYPSAKADVEFTIPDGVVTIGQTAFRLNNNLQSVIIPNGVTTISFAAFNICQNLTSITIPNTVTYIGNLAFVGCSSLSTIYYTGTQAQWNAITKEAEWNVIDWDGNVGTFTVYFMGECETNGHTWGEWVITTAPGCSTTGVQTRTCSACGATEEDANVPATGEHTYGQWVITTAPTTEAAGEETRTCTQCGAQETRAIDKLVSETDPQIYMESVKAKAGDSITVNVYIKNNPGVMYLNLTLSYDPVVMTLVSVTNGELLDTMTSDTNIVWDATGNRTADGLLCTLEFRLSENVEEGQYVISATLNEAYNEAEENVKLGVVAATVEVVNITYGDANGDGVVNGKDLMVLRKYMANFNFSTGESTVAVEAGADANGDGTINGKDLMLLRKYMANYNFSTGESTVVLGPTG